MKPNFDNKAPLHPRMMNSGPKDYRPSGDLQSNYNPSLPSNKYFTQKEINSKPTKRINAALAKKSGPAVKKDNYGADFDELESMRSSGSSFYTGEGQVVLSDSQKQKIQSKPMVGKFKKTSIKEDEFEAIKSEEEVALEQADREQARESIKQAMKDREDKINDFSKYLESLKNDGGGEEVDQIVDENQSREELERQLMDEEYVKDKISEYRENSSMATESDYDNISQVSYEDLRERGNRYVQSIDKNSSEKPKQILYKPPALGNKPPQNPHLQEDDEAEGIEDIRARIAKQLEGFHKQKQLALTD